MNLLGNIKRQLQKDNIKLTQVQVRLISKELAAREDFTDIYWVNYQKQKRIFVHTVSRYTNISMDYIESLL